MGVGIITIFSYDQRLGIDIPTDTLNWSSLTVIQKEKILMQWEQIRGTIPDRIKELEMTINKKQEQLNNEVNFTISCELNSEIAELASVINDLWLWYRVQQDVEVKMHQ
ncbi:MAG: radical SAM protein [Bacillaceae bacterium]